MGHCVCLALGVASALGALAVDPAVDSGKRAFSGSGGLVSLYIWKLQGKLVFGNGDRSALGTVDQRNRLAPIALAAENPVAQFVVYGLLSDFLFFKEVQHFVNRVLLVKAVKEFRVHVDSVFGPSLLLHVDFALQHFDYRKVEFFSEVPVAGVVRRNCHDGSGSV